MLNKWSLEQSKKIIDSQAFRGDKWTCLKTMNIQWVTNEKVKFLEILTLKTDYYEENCSQMFYRKSSSENFLKDICAPSKMQPLNFEKKNYTGCLLSFYKKIKIFSKDIPKTLCEKTWTLYQRKQTKIRAFCNNSGVK